MPIDFDCPACDATIRAGEDRVGKQVRCAGCGEVVRVPTHRSRRSLGGAEHREDKPSVLMGAAILAAVVVGWLCYALVSKRDSNRHNEPEVPKAAAPATDPPAPRATGEVQFNFLVQLDSMQMWPAFDPPRGAYWVTHGILTDPAKNVWTQVLRRYSVPDFRLVAEYRVPRSFSYRHLLGDRLVGVETDDDLLRRKRPGLVAYDLTKLPVFDPKKPRPDLDPVARLTLPAGGLTADPDGRWVYTVSSDRDPRDPFLPASKYYYIRVAADLSGPPDVLTHQDGKWFPSTLNPLGDAVTVGVKALARPPAWVDDLPGEWWARRNLRGLDSKLTSARIRLPDRGFGVSRGDWNLHEFAWSPDRVVRSTPLSIGGGAVGEIALVRNRYLFAVNTSPAYIRVLRVDTPLPDGAVRPVCDDFELPRAAGGHLPGGITVSPDGSVVVLSNGLVFTVRYPRE